MAVSLSDSLHITARKKLSCSSVSSVEQLSCVEGSFVLKQYKFSGISTAEALSLELLREQSSLFRIPKVIDVSETELLLELVIQGRPKNDFHLRFSSALADLHKVTTPHFGFSQSTYLGETKLTNYNRDNWIEFFLNQRFIPLVEAAHQRHRFSEREHQQLIHLIDEIPTLLAHHFPQPTLIHGDLWSGNYFPDEEGTPTLIDPALFYGDRELEFGMLKLFGPSSPQFYRHYESLAPFSPGANHRITLYMCYHLLNHAVLFGGAYCADTQRMISTLYSQQ